MRKLAAFLTFFLISVFASAQWVQKYSIEGDVDFIRVDNLLNIYRIYQSEVAKFDDHGKLQFRYSDKQLGAIGGMDVSYSLRPLVLYPELNYLVLLDNTLSNNRGSINLLDHDIGLGILACSSVQNHFWVYDSMRFSLIRTDENFNTVSSTGNLSQILGVELNPTGITEYANRVYLNNPTTGILVFDVYGTYIKTIPIKGIEDFQVFENEIVYFSKGKLIRYKPMIFQSEEVDLPVECKSAYIQKNRLFLVLDKKILVFQKSNP